MELEKASAKVRCVDCGILGKVRGNTQELFEIIKPERDSGDITGAADDCPRCAAVSSAFEMPESRPLERYQLIASTLKKERCCEMHITYWPTRSPKEHMDMKLAEIARAESAKRETEMKDWQVNMQKESVRASFNNGLIIAGVSAFVTLVVALVNVFNRPDSPVINVVVPAASSTKQP